MSFFKKSSVLISGGNFTSITNTRKEDLLRKHIAPGAFHNSSERYDPPKCHPQTRVAVIQAIIDWIEDGQKTSFIKWLYGPAGAGKSAIMQEIAELCHESRRLAAGFFWSRSTAGRNNEQRLIATLAYQLICTIPQIRPYVEEALENDPSLLSRSLAAQMASLIVEPLERVFGHGQQGPVDSGHPKLIILDGLDECGTPEAQKYILKVISDSVPKFPIPLFFLIASRPEQSIRGSFNDRPLLAITTRLALDEKYHPDDDIRLFLVESFESVKSTHELRLLLPRVWPTDNDIDRLVRKSSGQFIYAATVMKFVRSPRRRPGEQLDTILGITAAGNDTPFAELDALYCQIFSLVEDLPRALDILSVFFLVRNHGKNLTAHHIETILSYRPGDLQLILIDLHSVLNVPDVRDKRLDDEDDEEDEGDNLRVLHASLQDFLMDPARSSVFYIDKGQAHARIARHFLRYIHDYSSDRVEHNTCSQIVFGGLNYQCFESSATRELLDDFLDFDFGKWVSGLLTIRYLGWDDTSIHYCDVIGLYIWIQSQEVNVQEYFGPGRSLQAHLSSSWEAAVDLICESVCVRLLEEYPEKGRDAYTALTHPQIVHGDTVPWAFKKVIGVAFYFNDFCRPKHEGRQMVELQKYLCDPERAGRYFVHGGRYATLSVRILNFIFASEVFKHNQEEDAGGEKAEDDDGTPEDDSDTEDKYETPEGALKFAIAILPFYLANADYMPELARHADYLLSHKIGEKHNKLHSKIKLLHETVNVYLKKRPTSNIMQEQFQKPAQQNQLINLEPEKSIDGVIALSEPRLREEKRRRNSGESFEVVDSTVTLSSPSMSLPSKRLRIMDMLNPATGSQYDCD